MMEISKKMELEVRALFQKFSVRPVAVAILDRPTLANRIWTDGGISESSFIQMLRDNAARLQRRGCLHQRDLQNAGRPRLSTPFAGRGRAWRKGLCESGRREIRRNFAEEKAVESAAPDQRISRLHSGWNALGGTAESKRFRVQFPAADPPGNVGKPGSAPLKVHQSESSVGRDATQCSKTPIAGGSEGSENFTEKKTSARGDRGVMIAFHCSRQTSLKGENDLSFTAGENSGNSDEGKSESAASAELTAGTVRDIRSGPDREKYLSHLGESALFVFPAGTPRIAALVRIPALSLAHPQNSSPENRAKSASTVSALKSFGAGEADVLLTAFAAGSQRAVSGSSGDAASSASEDTDYRWREDAVDLTAALADEDHAAAAILDAASGEALYASKEAFRTFGIRGPFLGSTCLAPEADEAVQHMISLAENPARCVRRVDRFGGVILLNLFRNIGEMEAQRAAEQYGLTPSEEAEAMRMIAGLSCKDSAAHSGLTPETIRQKRKGIYRKMGVTTHGFAVARMMNVRLPPTMVGRPEKAG